MNDLNLVIFCDVERKVYHMAFLQDYVKSSWKSSRSTKNPQSLVNVMSKHFISLSQFH